MKNRKTLVIISLSMGYIYSQLSPPLLDQDTFFHEHELLRQAKIQSVTRQKILTTHTMSTSYSDYDVQYYNLNLSFDYSSQWINGFVEMKATSQIDELSEIELDLASNMIVDSISGDMNNFIHENDKIHVTLDTVYQEDEPFQITVYYNGHPEPAGFQALAFSTHNGNPIISSLSEPYGARQWWPSKDIPSDKADSADIWITIDSNLMDVSNGTLVSVIDNNDGTTTYHWHESYPITTYLISIAITNYVTFSHTYTALDDSTTMSVDYFVYPDHLEQAQKSFGVTVPMIEYYAMVFGEYPFLKEKYGMAEFQWGGAMEHQTCTSMGSGTISSSNVIAHELAHQWWGDMVTCASFQDIWLNEGFASYSEALYFGNLYGESYYHQYMAAFDHPEWWDGDPIFREDTSSVNDIFDWTVYAKGAWVLHMLRHVIGDENFFHSLLAYRDQYFMSVAVTEDFRDVCEQISGVDLDWFFEEWIYDTGRPYYSGYWVKSPTENGWNLTIQLDQIQENKIPFTMPIELSVQTVEGDTIFVLWDSLLTQTFEFYMEKEPLIAELDPENWVLKKVVNFSQLSTDQDHYIPTHFWVSQNYPNPFNQQTTLSTQIPNSGVINLKVYNIQGIEVWQNKIVIPYKGTYKIPINLPSLSSGIYILQSDFQQQKDIKKIILLK